MDEFLNVLSCVELVPGHVERVEVGQVPQVAEVGDVVVAQVDVGQLLQLRQSLHMLNPVT